jgi:hypothetical protein
MLSDNIMDYFFVAQGKTTIPGVDDAEELTLTDVRKPNKYLFAWLKIFELTLTSQVSCTIDGLFV